MKLCFPIQDDNGLASDIFDHFGSAPRFLIYNTEKKDSYIFENQDMEQRHGHCNPMRALRGNIVDAVIVGRVGAATLKGLNNLGIRVYQIAKGDIQAHIGLYKRKKLTEITLLHACGGHGQMSAHGGQPDRPR